MDKETIKQLLTDGVISNEVAAKYCPELKESEDEKIRKEIIIYLKSVISNKKFGDEIIESWIDWLEKQGKKPADKIEPRQEELTKFEKAVKQVMEEAIECGDTHNLKADADMLLSLVQNPAWSEEDERIIDGLISICDEAQDDIPRLSVRFSHIEALKNWLTSLKNRVQSQPKQEWNKDDENELSRVIYMMEQLDLTESWSDCYNWLKSLRPQNRWKLSGEQIKVCKEVYAGILSAKRFDLGTVNSELNRLEEELKKLR